MTAEERNLLLNKLGEMRKEYSEGQPGGDLQALKYKNHAERGYNKALSDIEQFISKLGE